MPCYIVCGTYYTRHMLHVFLAPNFHLYEAEAPLAHNQAQATATFFLAIPYNSGVSINRGLQNSWRLDWAHLDNHGCLGHR